MKKRILSILLTLCMTLCLTPISVFVEEVGAEGSAAIQLGADAISVLSKNVNTATAPTVYFGQNHDNNPAAWRVIGYDGSGVTSAQGDITLLAAGNMGAVKFADTIANNKYAPSNLKTAIDALVKKLTTEENAAVKKRTLASGSYDGENTDCVAGAQVDNAVFWPLSIAEASAVNNDLRIADKEHTKWASSYWWLRSPGTSAYVVAVVKGNGSVSCAGHSLGTEIGVRPAFNLNLNAVLFTSAAVGGKPDGGLTAVPEYSGNEWKLTLLDNSNNFAVTEKAISAAPGDTVTLHYTGASAWPNEYISAIIADSSGAQYYGRITRPDMGNGTVEIKIPSDLAPGSYTLKVFSEQYNGDYNTDYASNFTDIALTVENQPDEQFTLAPGGRYYFDLSSMNIPGTVNSNLPDSTLHYVPFIYAGTVNAYKLTLETATTEEYAQKNKYPHSLFVADFAVTNDVSWDNLNAKELIFGKGYAAGGVDYTLRAPSVGSSSRGSSNLGTPQSNEWDRILDKNGGYIKNWDGMFSWGQDTFESGTEPNRAVREFDSARHWSYFHAMDSRPFLGFRPVLELPTNLAADSLKIVELLTGEFMPGEQQNWINIIVKKGESFTAPSAEGLPRPDGISADAQLWWADDNFNFYKPGDTVPADVSRLIAFYGGLGLFLDRGNGEVEVTPDNYTDIFGDRTASFVLPKGKNFTALRNSVNLTDKDILEIYSTGRLEKYGCVFTNLKLKNADLTSVRLSEEYIGNESPLFITSDGKNTVGSLNGIIESNNTLSVLGNGSLTLNGALTLGQYTQFGGGSVTMTDGLRAYYLTIYSGSLTVTGDPQAITLRNQDFGYLEIGDGARLFTGSSAQDATEAAVPQLSAEMQELYQRYLAGDNTLTNEEFAALNNALIERVNAISKQLPGKAYVRITGAWDVTYQPGTNGSGNAVTDIKFYNDALTLKGKLFTRTGYTQVGWATTDGGEKVYGFDDVYTKNEALTLYPVWNANQYTITFDSNGGSEIAPITQDYGTNITAPADPTREGYTFIGWDRNIPEIMPAENIMLKARWKDIEKPTGEIKISENSWKAFLNNITFGQFFKDTQMVTITAADNSGETVMVEYLLSDKELTKAEFDGMTFTAYTAPFGIDPDNEYIIYVRLTDNAGNTDYICSDGIVLDGTSPVITGIEDGKAYCAAQIVTVDEKYIDTVKVSGNTVTLDSNNQFTLNPAKGEQTIVVTDKAGNETRVIVTVNDGHTYEWQSENGQYWQKCKFCNHETAKKDIPTINISGADKVCRMQDYKFSFTLPEGATDAAYGYEFIGLGDGPLTPTFEGGMYCGVIKSAAYPAEETSFKLIVSAKTADGFEFSAEKTVAIQNEHSGGTATCTEQATCEICGEKYGNLKPHSYSVKWSTGEASHWHECTECRAKTDEAEHTDTNKDHKCDVCDKVLSECADTNKDHKCDYCGKKLTEHSGGKATCKDKAKCEFCGESYGELNANNHSDLKHFPAVAATKTAEGNIEYWYCSGCKKYYKDATATQEIKQADTVTAKLPGADKSPQTGDNSNLLLWIALLFISGGAAIGTTVVSRKKKYNR